MTTPPRVQRHRQTDAARRRVNTRGRRVPRAPKQRAPKARRPSYKKSGALAGLSVVFSGLCFATGSIFWAVGAVTTTAASGYVARQTYKRELAQVAATGKPIGAKPKAGDPIPAGVTPTELDPPPPARKPQPRSTRKPGSDHHAAKCKANPPGGPTCRCPDGPNRKGKTTAKRAATRKRTTK